MHFADLAITVLDARGTGNACKVRTFERFSSATGPRRSLLSHRSFRHLYFIYLSIYTSNCLDSAPRLPSPSVPSHGGCLKVQFVNLRLPHFGKQDIMESGFDLPDQSQIPSRSASMQSLSSQVRSPIQTRGGLAPSASSASVRCGIPCSTASICALTG